MTNSLLFSELQKHQIDWLQRHPDYQSAWLIVYWHHNDNPELSFYSGKDIYTLYQATNQSREVFAVRGFESLDKAIEMCRALRVAYEYAVHLSKLTAST